MSDWKHGVRYVGAAMSWIVGAEASVVDRVGGVVGFGMSGPGFPAVLLPAGVLIVVLRRETDPVRLAAKSASAVVAFATTCAIAAEAAARAATASDFEVNVDMGSVFLAAIVVAGASGLFVGAVTIGRPVHSSPGRALALTANAVRSARRGLLTGVLLAGLAGLFALGGLLTLGKDGRERAIVAASAPLSLGALSAGTALVAIGASVGATVSPGLDGASESLVTIRATDWSEVPPDMPSLIVLLLPLSALILLAAASWRGLRQEPSGNLADLVAGGVGFTGAFAAVAFGLALIAGFNGYAYGEGYIRPSAAVRLSVSGFESFRAALLFGTVVMIATHLAFAHRARLKFWGVRAAPEENREPLTP
ncbi:MAG: hypothetical protein ACT4OS_12110 [Acidimicrobiales bacterium]